MATSNHYGTVSGAQTFFDNRLHSFAWENSTPDDRIKALNQATELVDQFDYIGDKYAVAILGDDATDDQKQTAELSQPMQFPRGDVNTVPVEIEQATYLIAQALLDGRNPDMDLEGLPMKSMGFADAKAGYDRTGNTLEHLAHLIPSPQAWNLLVPFLRERNKFITKQV
jgi:hypothetical protein